MGDDNMDISQMFREFGETVSRHFYKEVKNTAFEVFFIPTIMALGVSVEVAQTDNGHNFIANLRVGPFEVGFFYWR